MTETLSRLPDVPVGGYWKLDEADRESHRRRVGRAYGVPENRRPPTERQLLLLSEAYGRPRSMKTPIFMGGAMGGGKLLLWDTPIATPRGFRRIDDLRPGDIVMGRSGEPTCVTTVSDPQIGEAWKLTFDDGSSLIAHEGHEWLTFSRSEMGALARRTEAFRSRRRESRPFRAIAPDTAHSRTITDYNRSHPPATLDPPVGTVRTTREIVDTLRTPQGWVNHAIPVAEPLHLPSRPLPLDPYVLGVWLGDGSATKSDVTTMDREIVDSVVDAGFPVRSCWSKNNSRCSTYSFSGLRDALRSLDVLVDKRVPDEYLWGSHEQRLALLQGLLDTDGTVDPSGSVGFTNTNKRLVEACAHLARTLGHKVHIREARAKLRGKDCGPVWTIKFRAKLQVFRLPRKADRLVLASRQTTRFRYVVDATPVGPQRMRCISVTAPDHLYLAGESLTPTHNSSGLCILGISLARSIPGNRVLMCRKEYSSFSASTLQELEAQVEACSDARHWPGKHEIHFDNGSEIWYMGVGTPKQREKLGSTQFGAILIDEATEIEREVVHLLQTRLRWKPASAKNRLVLAMGGNPWPGWIKSDFVSNPKPGYTYIPARAADNPYLYEGYIEDMKAEMPEEWYRAFILGDWDAMVPTQMAIPYKLVEAARKRREPANLSDITWGVDVGHLGTDKTAVTRRMGYKFDVLDTWAQKRTDQTVSQILGMLAATPYYPHRIVIDYDGLGAGVADDLLQAQETGLIPPSCQIVGVHAQKTATIEDTHAFASIRYANTKAQLAWKMRKLLESGHGDLPDDDDVEADLTSANYDVIDGRLYIESKKLVRRKLGRSPDIGDSLLLTMFEYAPDEFGGLPANADQIIQAMRDEDDELTQIMEMRRKAEWYRNPFARMGVRHL